MAKILSAYYNLVETINGYELARFEKEAFLSENLIKSELSHEFLIFTADSQVFSRRKFIGSLSSTVLDIKCFLGVDVDIFIFEDGKYYKLKDDVMPFKKIYYLQNGKLSKSSKIHLRAVKSTRFQQITAYVETIHLLRRLEISNCTIRYVNLSTLKFLKYVKLINVGLEAVILNKKVYEHINFSKNRLSSANMVAKSLNLSHNCIEAFVSEYCHSYLNLSNNPLIKLICDARILIIRDTLVKNTIHTNSKVIVADRTKRIRIGNCPFLKSLSLSDCDLLDLDINAPKIKTLNVNYNSIEALDNMNNLLHLKAMGNILQNIRFDSIVYLNLSRNIVTSFDCNRFPFLKSVNLTFNPVEEFTEEYSNKTVKTIVLSKKLKEKLQLDRAKLIVSHFCKKYDYYTSSYKLESEIDGNLLVINVLIRSKKDIDYTEFLRDNFISIDKSGNYLDFVVEYSDIVFSEIKQHDLNTTASFVFITKRLVTIRSYALPILFYNFAEVEYVFNPECTRCFNNTSVWCLFPLLSNSDIYPKLKGSFIFRGAVDFLDVFQFVNIYCPKSVEFLISQTPDYFRQASFETKLSCQRTKSIYDAKYIQKFTDLYNLCLDSSLTPVCMTLGFENIDIESNYRNLNTRNSLANDSLQTSVFCFTRLQFDPVNCSYSAAFNLQVISLIQFLAFVFSGLSIERSPLTNISGFGSGDKAALFALYIQKVLKTVHIHVRVGISSEMIFSDVIEGVNFIYGPVLNKCSRITDLGLGIYSCTCVKFDSQNLEIIDEGDRFLKGFNKVHRICVIKPINKFDL